jgi:hypothetical protein
MEAAGVGSELGALTVPSANVRADAVAETDGAGVILVSRMPKCTCVPRTRKQDDTHSPMCTLSHPPAAEDEASPPAAEDSWQDAPPPSGSRRRRADERPHVILCCIM